MPETMEPSILDGSEEKEGQEKTEWQQHADSVDTTAEKTEMLKQGIEKYERARDALARAANDSARKYGRRAPGEPVAPEAVRMITTANQVRAEAHNAAARLAIEAGQSPAASELTIDQFIEAAGQDTRAPLVMAASRVLGLSGDMKIADAVNELAEFDPDLENLQLDDLALKRARDYIEKMFR